MKRLHIYIIGIVIATFLCFALGQRMPRTFTWKATFAHADRQPFGCYVFDSVMAQSMPKGYSVDRRTFKQLLGNADFQGKNILVLCDYLNMKELDFEAMDRLLHRGAKIMLAYHNAGFTETDSIFAYNYGVNVHLGSQFWLPTVKGMLRNGDHDLYDTVRWRTDDPVFPQRNYRLFSQLVSGIVIADRHRIDSVKYDSLVLSTLNYSYPDVQCPFFPTQLKHLKEKARSKGELKQLEWDYYDYDCDWQGKQADEDTSCEFPVAVKRKVGQGELIVVSMPYVFTNYGVLTHEVSPLLMRLMTQIADRPVLRTTSYMKSYDELEAEMSPMRYVLGSRELRRAWYLLAFVTVLFCVFKARRRQRIIPVVAEPKNHSLEFARLVGTLYWQRGDNVDLVRKKFLLFAERIRMTLAVDIVDAKPDDATIALMARRTGLDKETLDEEIGRLRMDYWTEGTLSDMEMRWAVDCMNRIAGKL